MDEQGDVRQLLVLCELAHGEVSQESGPQDKRCIYEQMRREIDLWFVRDNKALDRIQVEALQIHISEGMDGFVTGFDLAMKRQ